MKRDQLKYLCIINNVTCGYFVNLTGVKLSDFKQWFNTNRSKVYRFNYIKYSHSVIEEHYA